jgi:hypothetical protein
MNTPSMNRNSQQPTAPQPLTPSEALLELDQLDIRITRLEGAIDNCVEDITECRARILKLQAQRAALLDTLLPYKAMRLETIEVHPDESALAAEAPPVSLREAIRRSVCAEPGDYKAIAERLGVTCKQASAQLSRLHHRGDIGKHGSIYGPPGIMDQAVASRA